MPIKEIKREHISSKVSYPYIQEQHVIRDLSLSLSNLILQSPNTENGNVVSYSIRETIRNVFEHSRSNSCFIAGQKWHNGSVQIAIIDEGIGIYNSLSKEYNINDNRKALELCIQPGISGQKIKLESDLNSGYGLYVLSKLGARYGWFMIGSGNNILRLSRNARIKDTIYHGTFVGIHINNLNSLIFSFDKILEEIINTGELEAYEKGRATCASASSKLPY